MDVYIHPSREKILYVLYIIYIPPSTPPYWNWALVCINPGNYTYFLIGQIHRPQHWAMSVRFFSASLMSLLIESMPSSIRSNCSVRNRIFSVVGHEVRIMA